MSPYLLIINASSKETESEIKDTLKEMKVGYKLKSKNITKEGMDLILEVKTKQETEVVDAISEMEGIVAVSLLAHDGEIKG